MHIFYAQPLCIVHYAVSNLFFGTDCEQPVCIIFQVMHRTCAWIFLGISRNFPLMHIFSPHNNNNDIYSSFLF